MVRSLPDDRSDRRGTCRRIRRQGRDRQVRRRGERRDHDEIRRAQHPDDRFRQRRPGRRQTGWSLREGGPEGQDRKVRVGADNDPQEATAEQILPSSCLFISYLEKKIGN